MEQPAHPSSRLRFTLRIVTIGDETMTSPPGLATVLALFPCAIYLALDTVLPRVIHL